MSYHAVIAFPDDGGATLWAVLSQMDIRELESTPMEDVLFLCHSETDAVFVRCGLTLRPAINNSLLVPVDNQLAVDSWMTLSGMAGRYDWATLEHFEFFHEGAEDRIIQSFRRIVGYEPTFFPLDLWPGVFRLSVLAA